MSARDRHQYPCGCCEGIEALTPESLVNQPGLTALAYRVGTHGSFKETMLAALSQRRALHRLTSRDDNDPGIALLDACSTMLDVLTFYQERIANEGFLRTATERRSILELARAIGYELGTGVAASTAVVFLLETAPGSPDKVTIPIGTQAQSLPGQNEKPQIFETIEALNARVDWNQIKPQTSIKVIPGFRDKEVYLEGTSTGLKPGDGLLMIGAEREADPGSERWDFRRVNTVTVNRDLNYTHVTWKEGLGWQIFSRKVLPAAKDFQVFALRTQTNLFGYNAPDWRTLPDNIRNRFLGASGDGAPSSTNTAAEWPNFTLESLAGQSGASLDTIYLDGLHQEVIEGSWLVLSSPDYQEVYEVVSAVESSRKGFTLTGKATKVEVKGENLREKFNTAIRETVVFAEGEELTLAEQPVTDPVRDDVIVLEKLLPDLVENRTIIVSGRRMRAEVAEKVTGLDLTSADGQTAALSSLDTLITLKAPKAAPGGKLTYTLQDKNGFTGTVTASSNQLMLVPSEKDDPVAAEVATIETVQAGSDPTVIKLEQPLVNVFDRASVVIYGNVAKATHGESKKEVLGSGNAATPFQRFTLKNKPLTSVSAPTSSGSESTLEIRVDDILWKETDSLYRLGARDHVYVTRLEDDGTVTVQFGDGHNGARVPSGEENIKARYRVGIGAEGNVKAGQLSLLMTRILGVQKVINPIAASGAGEPETRDKARENAPFTVRTLDRIVSLRDFEDQARVSAGIGKAQATWLWDGESRVVHLTIAADTSNGVDYSVDKGSDLYKNLVTGIDGARDTTQRVIIDSYTPLFFKIEARILVDPTYITEKVSAAVTKALEDTYSFEKRNFGQPVHRSEVLAIMQNIDGVTAAYLDQLYFKNATPDLTTPLVARWARWVGDEIKPAELLLLAENGLQLTEITP